MINLLYSVYFEVHLDKQYFHCGSALLFYPSSSFHLLVAVWIEPGSLGILSYLLTKSKED